MLKTGRKHKVRYLHTKTVDEGQVVKWELYGKNEKLPGSLCIFMRESFPFGKTEKQKWNR